MFRFRCLFWVLLILDEIGLLALLLLFEFIWFVRPLVLCGLLGWVLLLCCGSCYVGCLLEVGSLLFCNSVGIDSFGLI